MTGCQIIKRKLDVTHRQIR